MVRIICIQSKQSGAWAHIIQMLPSIRCLNFLSVAYYNGPVDLTVYIYVSFVVNLKLMYCN